MAEMDEILKAKNSRVEASHRLQKGRSALVVVDMQRGFLDEGAALEVPQGREIVPNLGRLVAACREIGVPVVFTEFVYATSVPCLRGDPFGIEHLPAREDQPTGFGSPSNNCMIAPHHEQGKESADTIDALRPRPDELIIRGHTYDKFYGTSLDLALRSQDIRYLMLTGIVTDICVNATLMSASSRDYRVTAVTDGVATLWPERQQACFDIWSHKFARLKTTAELLEELASL